MKVFTKKFVQDEVTHQKGCGSVQKSRSCPESLEGKAAAIFTRGAYAQDVSTEKWRERR
jgi:hypothetical protein